MLRRTVTALFAAMVVAGFLPGGLAVPVAGGAAPASAAPENADAASFPGENGLIAFTKAWTVTGTPGADDRSDIFSVRPDGTGHHRLTFTRAASNPQWSPSGGRIAYEYDGSVWVMKKDGSAKTQLIAGELIGWLPTGGRILVAEGLGYSNGVQPTWTLYTLATGAAEVLPIELPLVADLAEPYVGYEDWSYADEAALSPDGETLAVMLWREDSGDDGYSWDFGSFFLVGLDGTGLARIPKYTYSFGSPAWSTAGDQLLYWSSEPRSGSCRDSTLRSIRPDGSSGSALIPAPCEGADSVWSPNGRKIAFVSNPGKGLRISNLDGSRITTVLPGVAGVYRYQPDWQAR